MNRLWVRLSLLISGLLFVVSFVQFFFLKWRQETPIPPSQSDRGNHAPSVTDLVQEFAGFSVVFGLTSGLALAQVISAPISRIAKAAQRLGKGDLKVRVPVQGDQEMRELAQTFNRMAIDLQHAESLRNNLMADVSHELRTPLTVLEGNLRAALDKVVMLDEAEIANLYVQTQHLTRLVKDLREISLADAGQLPLEKMPTDLQALALETLQALEPLASEKGILLLDELPALSLVIVDPFRIRQVLFNLLSNALQNTPAPGRIAIRGSATAQSVTLAIQDDGVGLEAEQLANVFERFYRADKSRSRETGGTGLGLSIVKAIVEAHGGKVHAFSAGRGKGSTFAITLPIGEATD